MHTEYDLVVIGGGAAGCSAAMFVARCKWKVLVVDRDGTSGHLSTIANVSCFPGFPESISGSDLLGKLRKQAELEGVKFQRDVVSAIAAGNDEPCRIMTEHSGEITAKSVVVSTGSAGRTNYLHGEKEFLAKGVSYDAITDAPSVARRVTAVVGRNRRSAEAAVYLSRFAEKVHLIIPSNKLDVPDFMISKIQSIKNIEPHYSTSLKRIKGTDHVTSIDLLSSGQEKELEVSGVFTYVHEYQPATSFLNKVVDLGENGAVKVDVNFSTTADGIFACGDVICGRPQLPAISSAQGIVAGMGVDRFLSKI